MNRSKFQFSNPELEKIVFSVNQSYEESKFDGISMQSNTEVKKLDGNKAKVSLTITIGNDTDTQPFHICITMSANFIWEDDIDDVMAKQLLNMNAPAVLLSYIRPIVSSLTNSSKYPTLNIPFIDFTQNES